MKQSCRQCSSDFEVFSADLDYYQKISPVFGARKYLIPPPSMCPECREQNRFAFRNEWSLYRRTCDISGKQIVSIYSPDKPYRVYEQSLWWSDQFDPLAYGRDFDFRRPFFEQWHELSLAVPRLSIHNAKSENCEYTNYSAENKNCYMAVGSLENEDILYCFRASYCKDVVDCYDPYSCELCYDVSHSKDLHHCRSCVHCHNSHDLILCAHCSGCNDCFGCVNLRQKKYHLFNQPYSPAEYRLRVENLLQDFDSARAQFAAFCKTQPFRAVDLLNCEESSGDQLIDCNNCHELFVFKNSEDCRYGSFGLNMISSVDVNYCNDCELLFHSSNLTKDYNVLFGNLVWYTNDSIYVTSCFNSSNLFGCVGMKKHQYCVFNKQYSREDYEALVPRIIQHMQSTGEWGEYFPVKFSPFAYNETAAQDYYPQLKDVVLQLGWQWHDDAEPLKPLPKAASGVPKSIADVPDGITAQILHCSVTQKPFRIVPKELEFYRKMEIPLPEKCPEQRRKERLASLNPHRLWNRACFRCKEPTMTSYSPSRPEIVFCERCYLEAVY